ncbi:MAG TPA: PLP-dependent aminotransferase family protein [Thermoanaerobaculia bacterium]|nr:PLP-dependent aminotransferase family protein [Thermoanaerobaculia bacterium]
MKRAASGIVPLLALDRAAAKPLYRQLYEGFREAILAGRLGAGQRLPSTRSLAGELQISRLPVLTAFEQLLAEGYFESRAGAGTFVARSLADPQPASGVQTPPLRQELRPGPRAVAANTGLPPPRPAPWLQGFGAFRVSQIAVDHFPLQVWSSLVARHGRNPRASQMLYGDSRGDLRFRETLAAYLRTSRGVRCTPEQILVTSGSQHALALAARVLLDPGDEVWVEEPGYPGARNALAIAGARLIPVPVDEEGLDVAAGVARSPQARAAYVTPSHQYPLGATLPASRRLQILDWAQRSGAWLLEDDYDSEYRYESQPIAALQGLDRDSRVIYTGTFSKVLFPALRVGYLVVPADLVSRFVALREAIDDFPSTLYQAVLTDFLAEGHFARHLRRMRLLYRERRGALVEALQRELGVEVQVIGERAGMHLTAILGPGARDLRISEQAAHQGLWAMPLSSCYLSEPTRSGLVLGYGGTGIPEIRDGVRRLGSLLREG